MAKQRLGGLAVWLVAGLMALTIAQPAAAKYASLIIDARTGAVLEEYNADDHNYPASLTKMMTLYLTFEALERGKVRLSDRLHVSAHAAGQSPSKLNLIPGQTITVEQAILALTVKSANDVAVVLAEGIGGSESRFAELMTQKARALDMRSTTFRNASGLPNPGQMTTARDLATLARALIRTYPQYYHYFSAREFAFEGNVIPTHNHVLVNYEGADGLKTGYIHASGFNLVTSAVRNGRRLIGVVLGGTTSAARDHTMMRLLDAAFAGPSSSFDPEIREASVKTPKRAPFARTPQIQKAAQFLPAPVPPASTAIPAVTAPAEIAGDIQSEEVAFPDPALSEPAVASLDDNAAENAAEPMAEPVHETNWGIQVGAYGRVAQARAAALKIQRSTPKLTKATIAIGRVHSASGTVFRARLLGLSEKAARNACTYIQHHKGQCVLVSPGNERTIAQVSQ